MPHFFVAHEKLPLAPGGKVDRQAQRVCGAWCFFFPQKNHVSNEKNLGCVGCIGDYTTQLHGDFFISQYKDAYKPTSNTYNGKQEVFFS